MNTVTTSNKKHRKKLSTGDKKTSYVDITEVCEKIIVAMIAQQARRK